VPRRAGDRRRRKPGTSRGRGTGTRRAVAGSAVPARRGWVGDEGVDRFALVRCEGGNVDEGGDGGVGAGFADDRAAVGVSDEDGRTVRPSPRRARSATARHRAATRRCRKAHRQRRFPQARTLRRSAARTRLRTEAALDRGDRVTAPCCRPAAGGGSRQPVVHRLSFSGLRTTQMCLIRLSATSNANTVTVEPVGWRPVHAARPGSGSGSHSPT
jgi:hypothetical protein